MPTEQDVVEDLSAPPADSPSRQLPLVELAVVAAASLVVLAALDPAAVLTNVLPWRTDLTGHVVVPWVGEREPLSWLPGSWSDTMFLGFPINQLYPWLPSAVASLLAHVLPLAVAFKIVVVAPLVAMPWAMWGAARWGKLPAPLPAVAAVATLPFLFDTACASCGGTITSTLTGEYTFAWSMVFAILALGAVDRLGRTGRGLATSALLVSAAALSHPLPTLWLAIGIGVIAVAREVWTDRAIAVPFGIAALAAALMSAVWWVPFLARRDWMPLLGYQRRDDLEVWLLPGGRLWELAILALALLGTTWAARRRHWLLIALAIQTAVAVAAFLRVGDGGQLYNLRVLPFWYLGRWVLAFAGAAWLVLALARRWGRRRDGAEPDPVWVPVAALAASVVLIGSAWGWWGTTIRPTELADGSATIAGAQIPVTRQSTLPGVVLGGPSTEIDRALVNSLVTLVAGVAEVTGCGRLAWDESTVETPELTVDVFQLPWQAPLWTDGCITPLSGVLIDSSATAGTAIMTQDLVSTEGLRVMPSVPDLNYNLTAGVERLRTMGVRYYLTHGGQPEQDAQSLTSLSLVASAGPWSVWEVAGSAVVVPLASLPAVVDPRVDDQSWTNLATAYFASDAFDRTPLAQDGPLSWPRVALGELPPDAPVRSAVVTNVRTSPRLVEFTVDEPGAPVLVRVSDYPGWSVEGAEGPYRVTPNFLVVIPTDTTVRVVRGLTTLDVVATALGAVGLGLLVALAVFRVLERRDEEEDPDAESALDEASSEVDEPVGG